MRRNEYAEQEYRKDYGDSAKYTMSRGKNDISFSARRVEPYDTTVMVSDKATIKPKALHEVNMNTEKALKDFDISKEQKPSIVILSDEELPNALGLYDACTNTVYYSQSIANKEIQALAGGNAAVERHEMWHAKQAKDYREQHGAITRENKAEYLQETCEKAKKNLDNMGITIDNVSGISKYASDQYMVGRYDEVEAEVMTVMTVKKV